MHRSIARSAPVVAAGVGAVLGYACADVVFVGSGLSLVPWGLAGLAIGALADSPRRAALLGVLYGFALAYVFMIAGYDGAAALRTRLAPFLVFGAVGAVCGAVLAVIGCAVRRAAGSGRRRSLSRRRGRTGAPPGRA